MLKTIVFNIEEQILRGLSEKWLETSFMIMSIISLMGTFGNRFATSSEGNISLWN